MAEGQLRWENRNLTRAENLKFATARKPTLSPSIYISPSRSKQMVFPLVHSQHKFDSVLGGEAQGEHLWRLQTKRNQSKSDSENEAAEFPRLIVMEFLDKVCFVKLSSLLIENLFQQGLLKKTRNGNLLVEADGRWKTENILKMKIFHTTKCRAYLHERLNISKGVIIRSRELA